MLRECVATERVGREMRRRAACGKGSGRDVGSLVMMDESSTQMHRRNGESVCVCVCVRDRERSESTSAGAIAKLPRTDNYETTSIL